MRLALIIVMLVVSCGVVTAQRVPKYDTRPPGVTSPATASVPQPAPQPFALKRPGHYTLSDWRRLIDSAWGPGISIALKLQTFDAYWNKVHQTWGGFPNLIINWDSLRSVYRPQVQAGVTRGRFAGILSRLTRALSEWHVTAADKGIDSTMGITWGDAEYPNMPSFHYVPGVPLLNTGVGFRTHFGAGITSLGDSLAMVYSAMPNHPLNLQPGDIILGYDGKPWKQLARELFDAELPVLFGGPLGSTPAAVNHVTIMSAGANWGLFDTIDVMKYPSNEIVHYPTALLKSIVPPYPIATEELPVKGVAFPDIQSNNLVSWGVVEGTSIGYVYVWDWLGVPDGNTRTQFGQAIDDLMHTRNVTGLILDFRTNHGGWEHYANIGFGHLFNIDPTNNYSRAWRVPGNDHFNFTITPAYGPDFFTPTPEIFDHPLAVLTGPNCGSAGDYNAFRLRFHPMVRFFGKPAAGAYTDLDLNPYFYSNNYLCRVDPACTYSNVNNETYMIHKAFPVDEEVWLTREGVAKGEDDVVKRAVEWITTLSYAHDTRLLHLSKDTLCILARVKNPLVHSLNVAGILRNGSGALIDSMFLKDDGLHGDSLSGDGLWGYQYVPKNDDTIRVTIRTDDLTTATSRTLTNAAEILFTRIALVSLDTRAINLGRIDVNTPRRDTTFVVQNIGFAPDSLYVLLDYVNIPSEAAAAVSPLAFELAPGGSQEMSFSLYPQLLASGNYYNAVVMIDSRFGYGTTHFEKVITFQISGVLAVGEEPGALPKVFALGQNYPNPFNPTTVISYQLPVVSNVKLVVYDVLGREVATVMEGVQEPGYKSVEWNANGVASGVYLYRLTTGNFMQTRKLVLLR